MIVMIPSAYIEMSNLHDSHIQTSFVVWPKPQKVHPAAVSTAAPPKHGGVCTAKLYDRQQLFSKCLM
ncbi:hypothetical protein BLOT_007935 [Blomia tropicalis]|nr:hypothetical protein BLOT_007935 [Blomia tropicalis]